ncbi:hypothetical protein EVAR_42038_1 [Eumeta japonica]|uniref:Uncharacterized protein n=1 Tax=Eumeta variegata TaxID=151549 RepID=A0A4C1Y8D2_EUMVA|nr:hypothetical protein EVAR_42038_1 [Eumeta japonica]
MARFRKTKCIDSNTEMVTEENRQTTHKEMSSQAVLLHHLGLRWTIYKRNKWLHRTLHEQGSINNTPTQTAWAGHAQSGRRAARPHVRPTKGKLRETDASKFPPNYF